MENVKFENLQLCPEILKAVKYMGFEEASPIQAQDRYGQDRSLWNSPAAENQS